MTNLFTSTSFASPNMLIKKVWNKLHNIPGGKWCFSKMVGFAIPYTGSVRPIVQKIENGAASVTLNDKRAIRNHLNSIHAIALANLGEFTTGLALISQLNDKAKAILVKLEVEYLKKARGKMLAEAIAKIPENITTDQEYRITADIKNLKDEIVCRVHSTWRVRPVKQEN